MRATTGLPARNQRDEADISTTVTMDAMVTESEVPTFAEAAKVWARIVCSFGGPAGQIALMHKELVEERRWIGEQRFLLCSHRGRSSTRCPLGSVLVFDGAGMPVHL